MFLAVVGDWEGRASIVIALLTSRQIRQIPSQTQSNQKTDSANILDRLYPLSRLEESSNMSRAKRALVVAAVVTLGLWGCARGPGQGVASAERVKALEAKINKLEDDFRAAATARDQARQKLNALDEQKNQLQQEVIQLTKVVKERDQLRTQVTLRTSERDSLQNQYDQFRKSIRDLLGQAEAGSGSSASPGVTIARPDSVPGKS
jgi:hypothetical protein